MVHSPNITSCTVCSFVTLRFPPTAIVLCSHVGCHLLSVVHVIMSLYAREYSYEDNFIYLYICIMIFQWWRCHNKSFNEFERKKETFFFAHFFRSHFSNIFSICRFGFDFHSTMFWLHIRSTTSQ